MHRGLHLAILSLLMVAAVAALVSSGRTSDIPDDRVMCDECHDDFVPFQYTIDAPTGVPAGEPFTVSITMFNEEMYAVYDAAARLTVTGGEGMVIETGEPAISQTREQGTVGFRDSTTYSVAVEPGAQSAYFSLDGSGGFLDDIDLYVTGPEGGSWSSTGGGMAETIDLDASDLMDGGFGNYQVTVDHPQGIRTVSFTLNVEVGYGSDAMVLYAPEALQQDDSYTFEFILKGDVKGPSEVTVVLSGMDVHSHSDGEYDEEAYSMEEVLSIGVGSEFVYGHRDGGSDGDLDSLLSAGQALGFLSATLLAASLATSGNLPRLPRRRRVHCYASYGLAAVLLVHWATLWAGPYGSSLEGIGTGGVMLVLAMTLAVTGVRPKLLDGRVLGWSNRVLHRNMTYVLIAVLVVHVVLNGSHFAVLRGA